MYLKPLKYCELLAIVIPYYKLTFFEKTLQSLADQTDKRFKVYIGNDASPETPNLILNRFQEKFSFHYHQFETNLGSKSLVKQWGRCLTMVGDEQWVMILGDDDTLDTNLVKSFYENLITIEEKKVNVVRFASKVINENDEVTSKVQQHPVLENAEDFLIRKFTVGVRSSLSEYIFKKEKIEEIKFKDFPLAWFSDLLAVVEFAENKPIYSINDSMANFRWSGINITSKIDDLLLKNNATFNFYKYLLNQYGKQFPDKLLQLLLDRFEKTIFDNKKNLKYWLVLLGIYLKFFQWRRFLVLGLKIKKSMQ